MGVPERSSVVCLLATGLASLRARMEVQPLRDHGPIETAGILSPDTLWLHTVDIPILIHILIILFLGGFCF